MNYLQNADMEAREKLKTKQKSEDQKRCTRVQNTEKINVVHPIQATSMGVEGKIHA